MALNDKFKWSNILPLICIFIYNFGFGLGLGPIPWFVVLQLFSDNVREAGNTICVVSNWTFAFIIVMLFPTLKKSLGMFGVMLFFAVICLLSIVFGFFFVKNPQKVDDLVDEPLINSNENMKEGEGNENAYTNF